jgi:hypothetical protein
MPKPMLRHMHDIATANPKLGQCLDDVVAAIGSISDGAAVSPHGSPLSAPPPVTAISVTAQNGISHVTWSDGTAPIAKGIQYHLEVDTDPAFPSPHVISTGPSRGWRGSLGGGPLYYRVMSQYPGGPASKPLAHPVAVDAGGLAGPPLTSTGSGTTSCDGKSGGQGMGTSSTRLGPNGRWPTL